MSRKQLDLTLGFLKALDRAASADDVRATMLGFLARYGVESTMIGTVPVPGTRPTQQRNHVLLAVLPPEWGMHYLRRGYLSADPTVLHLPSARKPFSWEEARARYAGDAKAVRVMEEAAEFGLRRGMTVPLLTLDQDLAATSFSGRHMEVDPGDLDTLHLVATYAFASLLVLRDREDGARAARLSPREREVLQWAAEGKTASDIGDVLSISTKGVEFHLRQVRRKLNTLNSVQSVAMALRRGLIS